MEPEFWIRRWEEGQTGFHLDEVNRHLQDHWPALALPADCGVFVPLCGKSLDLLWLRARGHAVLGVEISPKAVADFFAEHDLQPRHESRPPFEAWHVDGLEILQGDFFDLQPNPPDGAGQPRPAGDAGIPAGADARAALQRLGRRSAGTLCRWLAHRTPGAA